MPKRFLLLWGALFLSACVGKMGGKSAPGGTDPDDDEAGAGGTSAQQAGNGGRGGAAGGQTGSGGAAAACKGDPPIAPWHIARLTNEQYMNTLRALFPDIPAPTMTLPAEPKRVRAFANLAEAQNATPIFVEEWQKAAAGYAQAFASRAPAVLQCPTPLNEAACGSSFVNRFGREAFRQPLSAAQKQRYEKLFSDARTAFGFNEAISVVIEAILQSPNFLYRPEVGQGTGETRQLSSHELAARLSYFLWNAPPDAALAAAADADRLQSVEDLQKQAERLLASPKARAQVASFHDQWIPAEGLGGLRKTVPGVTWNTGTANQLQQSLRQLTDWVFWDGPGTLESLLTTPRAFVNDATAPFFGAPAPGRTDLAPRDLDRSQRLGILTHPALLATLAHEDVDSSTRRGVFVLEHILCRPPPSPPDGTDTRVPIPDPAVPRTSRQRMEEVHSTNATCKGCHKLMDGIGFGFSHYDAVGRWRTKENNIDINAKGEIVAGTDVDGPFDGTPQLAERLARSRDAALCVASHWNAYARAIALDDVDACQAESLVSQASRGGLEFKSLLAAIVKSKDFRFLRTTP